MNTEKTHQIHPFIHF